MDVLVESEVRPMLQQPHEQGVQPVVKDTRSSPLKSMASTIASAASLMETSSSSPTVEMGMIEAGGPILLQRG